MEREVCSHCGFTNRGDAQFCTQCGQALSAAPASGMSASGAPSPAMLPARPGCLTVYAVLLILGAVANAAVALLLLKGGDNPPLLTLYILGLAIAGVAVAMGLFRQKNWARIGAILFIGLSMAGLALQALVVGTTALPILVGATPALLIIWWFAKNKQYFA